MEDCKEFDVLTVTTTVPTLADAERLAGALVQERLAACVQIDAGVRSFYRWKGQLCDEPELRLVIKTLPGMAATLQAFMARHHPYELPQFLAVPMRASAAYAQWVRDEVRVP